MTIATQLNLDEYKIWKDISTASQDESILRMLESAFTTAESWTGLTLNRQVGTTGVGVLEHWVSEGNSDVYWPTNQPIISVASLKIGDETISASPVASFTTVGYYIDGSYKIKLRGYSFGEGVDCYLYSCYGIPAASMPADLKQAIYELAAIKLGGHTHLGQKSTAGVTKETTTWFDNDVTPSIAAVFDRYKLVML